MWLHDLIHCPPSTFTCTRRHVFVLFGMLRWLGVSCIHRTPRSNYGGQYKQGTVVPLGHSHICWQDALVGQPAVDEHLRA